MRLSREPEDAALVSRALKEARRRPEAPAHVENLVQTAVDAAGQGDTRTVTRVLGRIIATMGDGSLADYVSDRLSTLVRSEWAREVRVAFLTALATTRDELGDLSGAVAAVEEAFALAPGAEQLTRLVSLTARTQGATIALTLLTERMQNLPADATLTAQQASLELDLEHYGEAERLTSAALESDPQQPEALAVRARLAIMKGRAEDALEPARSVIATQPSRGRALLAVALDRLGRGGEDPGLVTAVLVDLPTDVWVLEELAQVLLSVGRYRDVVTVLTRALQVVPGHVEALRTRGFANAMLDDFPAAAHDLDQAREVNDDPWLTALRGEVARLSGALAMAVELFRSLSPDTAPKWVATALGECLLALGDVKGARESYEEALARDDRDVDALYGLARTLMEDDGPSSALAAEPLLRKAVDIDDAQSGVHALLGETLRRQGRLDDAIVEFDEALRQEPGYTWALGSKAQALLALGEADRGIEALITAAHQTPEEEWILDELLEALQDFRPDSADRELRRLQRSVRERGGEILPICSRRARLAHQLKRWEAAASLFEQALEVRRPLAGDLPVELKKPVDRDLAADYVDVLRHLGRRADALAVLEQLSPSTRDVGLTRVRIDLLWSLNRLTEARPELEAMYAKKHASPQVVAALGECYRLEGRRKEALALLEAANRREPDQPYVLASLGALELDRDRPDEARRHLERAQLIMPAYEFALGRLLSLELAVGHTDAARKIAETVIDEHNPELVQVQANALYELGEYSQAVETLDSFLTESTGSADIIRLRGWAALALGQRREAGSNFSTAARLPTVTPSLLPSMSSLVRVAAWTEALGCLERARGRSDPYLNTATAELHLAFGDWAGAVEHAVRGQEALPTSAAAAMVASRALRMSGRRKEALAQALVAVDLRPADPWTIFDHGEALLAEGREEEARPFFQDTLRRLERRVHLHSDDVHLLGRCMLRLGRVDEAADVFLRSLTLTDRTARALFSLLLAFMLSGSRLQSEVLVNRTMEELATMTTPGLRGALALGLHDLDVVDAHLPLDLHDIAAGLRSRFVRAIEALPPDLESLAQISPGQRSLQAFAGGFGSL